jgi:hypothetical protein
MRKSVRKDFSNLRMGNSVSESSSRMVKSTQPIETKEVSLVAGAGFEPATFGL